MPLFSLPVCFFVGHLASPTSLGGEMDEDFEAPSRNQSHEDQENFQPEYMDEELSERVVLKRFASTGTLRNQSRASAVSSLSNAFLLVYRFLHVGQCCNILFTTWFRIFYVFRSRYIHIRGQVTIDKETTSQPHYRLGRVKMNLAEAVSSSQSEAQTPHHPQRCKVVSPLLGQLPPSAPTPPPAAMPLEDPFLLLHVTSEQMAWSRLPSRLLLLSSLRPLPPLPLQLLPCLPHRLALESRRFSSRRLLRLHRDCRPSMAISA